MNPIDRLHPSKAVTIERIPLSSASMTLSRNGEQGQFVRMFDTYGAVDVFRISKVRQKYPRARATGRNAGTRAGYARGCADRGYYEFGGTGVTQRKC